MFKHIYIYQKDFFNVVLFFFFLLVQNHICPHFVLKCTLCNIKGNKTIREYMNIRIIF